MEDVLHRPLEVELVTACLKKVTSVFEKWLLQHEKLKHELSLHDSLWQRKYMVLLKEMEDERRRFASRKPLALDDKTPVTTPKGEGERRPAPKPPGSWTQMRNNLVHDPKLEPACAPPLLHTAPVQRKPGFHPTLAMSHSGIDSWASTAFSVPGNAPEAEMQSVHSFAAGSEPDADKEKRAESKISSSSNQKRMYSRQRARTARVDIKDLIAKTQADLGEKEPTPRCSIDLVRSFLWDLFERPHLNARARLFNTLFQALVFLSVCSVVISTTFTDTAPKQYLLTFDLICNIAFTFELIIKICACPSYRKFFSQIYTWIDVAAVVGGYVRYVTFSSASFYLQLMTTQLPIIRLMKIAKHSYGWKLLIVAMKQCVVALLVPMYLLALMVFFTGSLLYWVDRIFLPCTEDGCPVELSPAFTSIPHAMWFVVATVSTVGYGDVVPRAILGRLIAAAQIIAGICYMAMPLTIIGANFAQVWDDRHRLIMRGMLSEQAMYVDSVQLRKIFDVFDPDGSGELSFEEFLPFVDSMNFDLPMKGIRELFDAIDASGDHAITFDEFIDYIYPEGIPS